MRHTQRNSTSCIQLKKRTSKVSTGVPGKTQTSKIKIGAILQATLAARHHVIPEEWEITYTGSREEITTTNKYNTRTINQKVHHVTTFKNTPTVFPIESKTKTKLHRGTDYYIHIDPKKYAITWSQRKTTYTVRLQESLGGTGT